MMIAISEAESGNSKKLSQMLRQPNFDPATAENIQKFRDKLGLKNLIDIGAIVTGIVAQSLFID